jgi:hypothetical protein
LGSFDPKPGEEEVGRDSGKDENLSFLRAWSSRVESSQIESSRVESSLGGTGTSLSSESESESG